LLSDLELQKSAANIAFFESENMIAAKSGANQSRAGEGGFAERKVNGRDHVRDQLPARNFLFGLGPQPFFLLSERSEFPKQR